LQGISTCDWTPDNYHPTWDFRNPFTSQCIGLDQCSEGDSTITHTCNQPTCGAECDDIFDCGNKCIGNVRYYSGICDLLSTCTCSWSTENCDAKDGCYVYETGCEMRDYSCYPNNCDYTYSSRNTDYNDSFVNYCSGSEIRKHKQQHDFYCNGQCSDHTSWVGDQLVQDCNLQDGWYNTTNYQWISSGQCTEKEQRQQEYRDYICSAAACAYSITNTRWIDTGNTRNKPNGTSCNDNLYCTVNDICTNGICGGSARDCSANNLQEIARCDNNPDNYLPTFDYASAFTSTCDEINDRCTIGSYSFTHTCADSTIADDWPLIGGSTRTCTAQCDQNSDCASGLCKSDCTCAQETNPPVITIQSPTNTSYAKISVPLNFTLDKSASWCGYSLDGAANKTLLGCANASLEMVNGSHSIVVYANDSLGNMGSSTKAYFFYCRADLNKDKKIDIFDVVAITALYECRLGYDACYNTTSDLNSDNVIDIYDVVTATSIYDGTC
jgi:hypothetical protein